MLHSESSLKKWACPRLWAYHKVVGVRSLQRRTYFEDGRALHAGLGNWHLSRNLETAITAMDRAYRTDTDYDALWEVERPPIDERIAYCGKVLEAYARKYPQESFAPIRTAATFVLPAFDRCPTCLSTWGPAYAARYLPQCLSCNLDTEYMVGELDLLYFTSMGRLVITDHKTSEKRPGLNLRYIPRSPQLLTYAWAVTQLLPGYEVGTQGDFLTLLATVDKRADPFERSAIYWPTPNEIHQHIHERRHLIRQIRKELQLYREDSGAWRRQTFLRNTNQCRDFGLCSLFELCHPPRPDWGTIPDLLLGDFELSDTESFEKRLAAQQDQVPLPEAL